MILIFKFNTLLLFDGDAIAPFLKKLRISAILLKINIVFISTQVRMDGMLKIKRNVVVFLYIEQKDEFK